MYNTCIYFKNVIQIINYIGILFFPTWRMVLQDIENMQSKKYAYA